MDFEDLTPIPLTLGDFTDGGAYAPDVLMNLNGDGYRLLIVGADDRIATEDGPEIFRLEGRTYCILYLKEYLDNWQVRISAELLGTDREGRETEMFVRALAEHSVKAFNRSEYTKRVKPGQMTEKPMIW